MITRDEGIRQIETALWVPGDLGDLNLHVSNSEPNYPMVHCWLLRRPYYCDRGHIALNIGGIKGTDGQDGFPRYFFSYEEADQHTRAFLKWRLWKESYFMKDAAARYMPASLCRQTTND